MQAIFYLCGSFPKHIHSDMDSESFGFRGNKRGAFAHEQPKKVQPNSELVSRKLGLSGVQRATEKVPTNQPGLHWSPLSIQQEHLSTSLSRLQAGNSGDPERIYGTLWGCCLMKKELQTNCSGRAHNSKSCGKFMTC